MLVWKWRMCYVCHTPYCALIHFLTAHICCSINHWIFLELYKEPRLRSHSLVICVCIDEMVKILETIVNEIKNVSLFDSYYLWYVRGQSMHVQLAIGDEIPACTWGIFDCCLLEVLFFFEVGINISEANVHVMVHTLIVFDVTTPNTIYKSFIWKLS